MKTLLKLLYAPLLFLLLTTNAFGVELVNEQFTSNISGWPVSSKVYWTSSYSGSMFIDQNEEADETYNFGSDYSNQILNLEVEWCATEYALLHIAQDNNITNPCNYTGDNFKQNTFYDINISVKYIYTAFPATCNAPQRYATVTTAEQSGSILIDVSVSINDEYISSEQIRYSRRTIQKL